MKLNALPDGYWEGKAGPFKVEVIHQSRVAKPYYEWRVAGRLVHYGDGQAPTYEAAVAAATAKIKAICNEALAAVEEGVTP